MEPITTTKKQNGVVITAVIIVLLVLIIGAMLLSAKREDSVVGQEQIQYQEQANTSGALSTSDEMTDIEADLNSNGDFDSLDKDLE